MLGKLERLVVGELRITIREEIGVGVQITGTLSQNVNVAVEPKAAKEFAIATQLGFEGRIEGKDEPVVVAACNLIGFFAVDRKLEKSDQRTLTEEATIRANLQMYPIARGKLVRVMIDAGLNSPGFPLEQPLVLRQEVEIPSIPRASKQKATRKRILQPRKKAVQEN